MISNVSVSKRGSIGRWFGIGAICASMIVGLPAFSPAKSGQGKSQDQAASQNKTASKTKTDEAPPTPRERELEQQVQDLERRLAAVEAKLAATVPARHTETNAPAPAATSTESAASLDPAPAPMVAKTAIPPSSQPSAAEREQEPTSTAAADVQTVKIPTQNAGQKKPADEYPGQPANPAYWGEFNPGKGFTVASSERGNLNISGYMVARYLNQLPAGQTAVNHFGQPLPVRTRNDFQFHRVMLYFFGSLFSPKFNYNTTLWTVQDTNQVAIAGALTYNFNRRLILGLGWNSYPGTISLQNSHPYWPSYDRVMADEYFRPYFSQGIFAAGEILPRLEYRVMLGNNMSNLYVSGVQLGRDLSAGGALLWKPTTGEFGPRGGFGDFEEHQKLATRFGTAYTYSPSERYSPLGEASANTTIRLADSLNLFDEGALAPGVTVTNARYNMISANGGIKWHGFWLQSEGYYRVLNHFAATGPLPVGVIRDSGFYVQSSYMVVPKTFELYGATSWVFSKYGPLGEGSPHEYIGGANWYFAHLRTYRINLQVIDVIHSPVNSTFGFYIGGLKGPIVTIGATAMY